MRLIVCLSLGLVAYTYAGYPLGMWVMARFWPRPWKRSEQDRPVSIVMAVHNGATMLPEKLAALLSLDRHLVQEVIVVSDGSTDSTAAVLEAAQAPRLRAVVLPEQVGKAAALNRGVSLAGGEILLFVDIRPRIAPDSLLPLLSNFADASVGCVAGELIVRSGASDDATASQVGGLYWRYEQAIRNLEAAFDSPVGVYGGFYAIRRALWTPMPEGIILDDMFEPQAIIRQGFRSVVDRTAIVTDVWPARTSSEFQRKVRTLAGNFQLIAKAPWILSSKNRVLIQLVSHKLLRLVVPYAFAAMFAASWSLAGTSRLWMTASIVQTAFWLLALVSLKAKVPLLHRIGSPASALLVLNAAAVAGLYTFLFTRGPLWKIWKPAASERPIHASAWEEQERGA